MAQSKSALATKFAQVVARRDERIAELEAQLAAKWISVDTKPEYDTHVLLSNPSWPHTYVGYWRHSEEWIGSLPPECPNDALPSTNPTHWQPLPAPPAAPSGRKGDNQT